jgi:hypothetical protein
MTDRLEHGLPTARISSGHGFTTMRRDHRRPFDIEADEAADVTQQFWGATRGWSADGDGVDQTGDDHTPRSLQSLKSTIGGRRRRPAQPTRRVDVAGRTDRTRSHGIPRPPAEQLEIARREATLGELAAGWIDDDDWPELDLTPAPSRPNPGVRPAPHRDPRGHDAFANAEEFGAYPEDVDDEHLIPLSPVAPLASRLGLGAVDPLLARLGAIVVAGVLLLPLALAARGGSQDALADAGDAVPAADASADPTLAAGASTGAAEQASVATSFDASADAAATTAKAAEASTPPSGGDVAAAAAQASVATVTTEQSQAAAAATVPAADVPQSVSASTAAPADAATVNEPADRLTPDCSLAYEAGQGDSWYRIADAAGITPRALMDHNLAGLDTPIFPGDEICLPAGATIPEQPVVSTAPPATTAPTTSPPTTAKPTTTTTTVKPTTTTAPPAPPASTAEVQALIREIWPDELEEKALAVAWRESNYKATAYNGWCCYGVFQIHWTAHKSWLSNYSITSTNDLFDARKNITAAYALYQQSGGWGPWGG